MSNRNYYPLEGSLTPRVVTIVAFLSIKADASVDSDLSVCRDGTLAAGATGIYTLTLDDYFKGPVFVQLTPLKAAAADTQWEVVSSPGINGTTGKVITLRHVATSTGSAAAPAAVCGVMITAHAVNSSL